MEKRKIFLSHLYAALKESIEKLSVDDVVACLDAGADPHLNAMQGPVSESYLEYACRWLGFDKGEEVALAILDHRTDHPDREKHLQGVLFDAVCADAVSLVEVLSERCTTLSDVRRRVDESGKNVDNDAYKALLSFMLRQKRALNDRDGDAPGL